TTAPAANSIGIDRRKIVTLSVKSKENGIAENVAPTQCPEILEPWPGEKRQHADDPDRSSKWTDYHDLLHKKLPRREHNIAPFVADVPHELKKRPVIVEIPE